MTDPDYPKADSNMRIPLVLADAGYERTEEHRVWHRPDFGGIAYNDGDESESRLLETLRHTSDVSVFSIGLAAACLDWPSRYHLSSERANILRPFAERLTSDANVLEIGAGCGAVTRYLGETGAQVLAVEGSLRRATIARERTRELENVVVLAERFQDFHVDVRFDIITLIGVLEYASLFSDARDPAVDMLRKARDLLAPGGRLVVAIENKLGLKYLAGVPEDHLGEPMVGVENRYEVKGARTYGRLELDRLLCAAGFHQRTFMVPMPDYKMPATVISALGCEMSPDAFDVGTLAAQSVRRDPQLTPTTFNLQRAWREVAANGLTADLANSFLVEAGMDNHTASPDVLAWHFSTQRRSSFARETRFVRVGDDVRVRSRALGLAQTNEENAAVKLRVEVDSPYVPGRLLVDDIRQVLTRPGWYRAELAVGLAVYLEALQGLLENEGEPALERAAHHVLPGSFLDATPSNLIRAPTGEVTYFDREWHVATPTLGWLLTRSLLFTLGGTPVAAMAAGEPEVTVRELVRQVVGELLLGYDQEAFDEAVNREIGFQVAATGRDPGEAIQTMLDATVPHQAVAFADAVTAPTVHSDVVELLNGLQHSMNLAAQHQINVYATVDALHERLADLSRKFEGLCDAAGRAEGSSRVMLALEQRLKDLSASHVVLMDAVGSFIAPVRTDMGRG